MRPVAYKKHGVCRACYERMRRQGEVGPVRTCSITDCEGLALARGMCDTHYRRARYRARAEQVNPYWRSVPLTDSRANPIIRFNSRYTVEANGCWQWTGPLTNGYGQFGANGKSMPAHRFAYQTFVGPIPDGYEIDHVCHTRDQTCTGGTECPHRRCVNPAHMEPVTQRENTLRSSASSARWAQRDTCDKCGGAFTLLPNNTRRRRCITCYREYHRIYQQERRARTRL